MSRRKRGRDIHGILLLDKPVGISSNRALQSVRRLFDARKAGHTGSLDPFASGMLPICLGEASKTAAFMLGADKVYRARALLGVATDTGDIEGQPVHEAGIPNAIEGRLGGVLDSFTGEIQQIPPMYSALKHKGKPLYRLAREGVEIEREARTVTVHRLSLLDWNSPMLDFEVHCSKGTYIRTLAEDIAKALGSCAHLVELRRLFVAPFDQAQMVGLDTLEKAARDGDAGQYLLPVDAGLPEWPLVTLASRAAHGFCNGNPQAAGGACSGRVRVYGPGGRVLGLGELGADGQLSPRRVFNIEPAPTDPRQTETL